MLNSFFMRALCVFSCTLLLSACDLVHVFNKSKSKQNAEASQRMADSLAAAVNTDVTELPDSANFESVANSGFQESVTREHDLIHTRLEVSFDWLNAELIGTCVLTLKPFAYPSRVVNLNARGMQIQYLGVYENTPFKLSERNTISVMPISQNYSYENDSLKIDLGRVFNPHESYQILIRYIASPNQLKKNNELGTAINDDKGLYFINPLGDNPFKMKQVWTQGETQSNSAWMPTIDVPNEKMTQDLFITVSQSLVTLSNGTLMASQPAAGGTRTDHWQMNKPHAPYLTMMAAGTFKTVKDPNSKTLPVTYYVEPEYERDALFLFGATPKMISFFSKLLNTPYPWPKYDQIVVRDFVSGAMENTSATLHGDFMIYQSPEDSEHKGESVIAHELFHQWFGDLVTCESWSHLPLNESFATYGEYLWLEHAKGRDAADIHQQQSRNTYFSTYSNGGDRSPIDYYYRNREDMFDAVSYNKGGLILHSLRKTLGDSVFFKGLHLYLSRHAFKTVEIHDLRLALEEVSGMDLNWFFNQWFLTNGLALVNIQKKYNAETQLLTLEFSQIQESPEALILPLDIDVYKGSRSERQRIWIKQKHQIVTIPCKEEPDWVNIDAEHQIVGYIYPFKSKTEFMQQLKTGPLAIDRLDALYSLQDELSQADVRNLISNTALNDPNNEVRRLCWQYLIPDSALNASAIPEAEYNLALKALKTEKDAYNRSFLVQVLLNSKSHAEDKINTAFELLKDTSTYLISYHAIDFLIKQQAAGKELLGIARNLKWQNETIAGLKLYILSTYGDSSDVIHFLPYLKVPGKYDLQSLILRYFIPYTGKIKNAKITYEFTSLLVPYLKYIQSNAINPAQVELLKATLKSIYDKAKSDFEICKVKNTDCSSAKTELQYAEQILKLTDGF